MEIALTLLFIAIFISLIVISYIKMKKSALEVKDIDKNIMESFCNQIAANNYTFVYQQLLNNKYKSEISFEEFEKAYQQKRIENGKLLKREYAKHHKSFNIFSKLTEYQIYYHLTFENIKIYGAVIVNNQDNEIKIEGTYIDTANESLSFYIW